MDWSQRQQLGEPSRQKQMTKPRAPNSPCQPEPLLVKAHARLRRWSWGAPSQALEEPFSCLETAVIHVTLPAVWSSRPKTPRTEVEDSMNSGDFCFVAGTAAFFFGTVLGPGSTGSVADTSETDSSLGTR